jgi:hypothetical protein
MNRVTAPGFVGHQRADPFHVGEYWQLRAGDLGTGQRAGGGD